MGRFGAIAVLAGAALLAACQGEPQASPKPCLTQGAVPTPADPLAGLVPVPGGAFAMGAGALRPEEGPTRTVRVAAFQIDRTEVTNAAFAAFVQATGYKTLAERPLDPALYPHLPPEARVPASLVFVGAKKGVDRNDPSAWWRIVPGADWRHPEGPGSSIEGKAAWPVVHIAYEDALAYARWLGRDLPTEAEWEFAARGGLAGKRFAWGDDDQQAAEPKANAWQGVFPALDTGQDGYKAQSAPVGCYPANGFGLHDMSGNVWEWTKDWFRPGLAEASVLEAGGPPRFRALDPAEPGVAKRVVKGGSFLCSEDYCFRYRPPARTAGPPDTGASHTGFRTVLRSPPVFEETPS
ncbi:MAG: formylglycine-generating enzyme family protein [Phenylobacterium sp.]|uniref:formylglycine-generating enzyme family protein n=1 Tax=Phenylobacterium sp. TaxID=1871053 RepID=UPI0039188754